MTLQSPCLHQGVAAGPTIIEDNPFAHVDNDPFINMFAPEPSSEASSFGDAPRAWYDTLSWFLLDNKFSKEPDEEPAQPKPEPEPEHQGEGEEYDMERAIQMSLESFQAQNVATCARISDKTNSRGDTSAIVQDLNWSPSLQVNVLDEGYPKSLKEARCHLIGTHLTVNHDYHYCSTNCTGQCLVALENQLEFGICNMRINPGMKPKEPTYQVVLVFLILTTCYPAFLITADVPAIYMYQF
ncbi:hypothetical protein Tco_0270588 [Tanacetum coccineum]